jgi:hypothetical protein
VKLSGILAWRDTDNSLEAFGQVTLTAKTDLDCHFRQRFAGFDQPLRVPDAHTFQVGIGWHACFIAKDPQQVVSTEGHVLG